MTISMYQTSVPVFQRLLKALDAILDKAVANATERKIDPAVLVAARLVPDMYPSPGRCRSPPTTPRAARRGLPACPCRASRTLRRRFPSSMRVSPKRSSSSPR